MPWKKTAQRVKKNLKKNIKRRYFRGKGYKNPKLVQMAKDILTLKNMVNAEKKRVTHQATNEVAQTGTGVTGTNPTNSGMVVIRDLFYTPPVGSAGTNPHNTRMGDSIKTCSYHLDFRVKSLNTNSPIRGKIYLVRLNSKDAQAYNDVHEMVLTPSVFDGKYDVHSPLNYEEMKNYTIIAQKKVYVSGDSDTNQIQSKYVSMGGKLGFHQRYETGTNQIDLNELALIYVSDDDSSLVGTGKRLEIQSAGTMYYYDN